MYCRFWTCVGLKMVYDVPKVLAFTHLWWKAGRCKNAIQRWTWTLNYDTELWQDNEVTMRWRWGDDEALIVDKKCDSNVSIHAIFIIFFLVSILLNLAWCQILESDQTAHSRHLRANGWDQHMSQAKGHVLAMKCAMSGSDLHIPCVAQVSHLALLSLQIALFSLTGTFSISDSTPLLTHFPQEDGQVFAIREDVSRCLQRPLVA